MIVYKHKLLIFIDCVFLIIRHASIAVFSLRVRAYIKYMPSLYAMIHLKSFYYLMLYDVEIIVPVVLVIVILLLIVGFLVWRLMKRRRRGKFYDPL